MNSQGRGLSLNVRDVMLAWIDIFCSYIWYHFKVKTFKQLSQTVAMTAG